ncbi:MarR family winged helix-turn-helix transcriptional regulator [Chelatococcus reniformis]|uniref:Hydroxycinnamic acid degradation regulator n=1 Tax=Chelatococcus reniformis TaxID=1494448 RepID=A0A916UKV6_9HYPH|nr:MarR family winged helix-turn-helix transcriptional regulator [Chelatococcus reniformis]GGC74641.1 hydroxycinnamic acid degradation regulator [Chelatococcus reniformis]
MKPAPARAASDLPVAEPAPDLSPLPDLVGYALRRTHMAVFRRFREAFADYDIRPVQLGVLTVVLNNPGLKQTAVGAALGIKRTNFGPLLDGLMARGLIERKRLESDRRALGLYLSPLGQTLVAELQAREAAFERQISATIGDEGRRDLLRLLGQIAAGCRGSSAEDDEPETDGDVP